MSEFTTLPPDDLRLDPCAPADGLTDAQRAVFAEHLRFTEALGMTAAAADFEPAAAVDPVDWDTVLSNCSNPYRKLQVFLTGLFDQDANAN